MSVLVDGPPLIFFKVERLRIYPVYRGCDLPDFIVRHSAYRRLQQAATRRCWRRRSHILTHRQPGSSLGNTGSERPGGED